LRQMQTFVLIIHVLAAAGVIGLVLLQHGKGADMGAAFGSGSAGSLFGSSGSANFLSRATAALTGVFFLTSLGLTYLSTRASDTKGVMSDLPAATQPAVQPGKGEQVPALPSTPAGGSKANEIPK